MNRLNDNKFGTVKTLEKTGISGERLRYWERVGIITPVYVKCGTRKFRRYSKEDVNKAILIKMLVDEEGYSLEGAKKRMKKRNR